MAYLHYPDCEHLVLNGIDDSVSTLTNTVSFLSREFFMPHRARVLGEPGDAFQNLGPVYPVGLWKKLLRSIQPKIPRNLFYNLFGP